MKTLSNNDKKRKFNNHINYKTVMPYYFLFRKAALEMYFDKTK
jgi:hypothetical protein